MYLNNDERHAYLSYLDLRSVQNFRNQTILAIKAPSEFQLQGPDPSEGIRIHMKAEQDEIEVYICQRRGGVERTVGIAGRMTLPAALTTAMLRHRQEP